MYVYKVAIAFATATFFLAIYPIRSISDIVFQEHL